MFCLLSTIKRLLGCPCPKGMPGLWMAAESLVLGPRGAERVPEGLRRVAGVWCAPERALPTWGCSRPPWRIRRGKR